jgi:Xaa-Pro aminopeptidase
MDELLYYGTCSDEPFLIKKTGCTVESKICYLRINRKESIIVPIGDEDYFIQHSKIKNIMTFTQLANTFKDNNTIRNIAKLLSKKNIINIPGSTPTKIYSQLIKSDLKIKISDLPFIEYTLRKNSEEIKSYITHGKAISECFSEIYDLLSKTSVHGKNIQHKSAVLNTDILRKEIAKILLEHNFEAKNIMVYAGYNTRNSHFASNHTIPAGMPIIIDLYPKNVHTGLHVDMTRTFIIGKPLFLEYENILKDLELIKSKSEKLLRSGQIVSDFNKYVDELFFSKGYFTTSLREDSKKSQSAGSINPVYSCIHGLGHGIGYAIHEPPTISLNANVKFEKGMVLAFEPGLYSKIHGGFRIEDDYIIKSDKSEKITRFKQEYLINN